MATTAHYLFLLLPLLVHAHHTGTADSICWQSPTNWSHCDQNAIHIVWTYGEPPHQVYAGTNNTMFFNLTINTSRFEICHTESIVPSANTCRTEDGLCSPYTVDSSLGDLAVCEVSEFADGHTGCVVKQPLEIDGYFPLYLYENTAIQLSPVNQSRAVEFGGLRLFEPVGLPFWEGDFTANDLDIYLAASSTETFTFEEVSCHSVLCSDLIHQYGQDELNNYTRAYHGVEFVALDPDTPEMVTASFESTFMLSEADTSHTVLVHADVVTCDGTSLVVSLAEFGVVGIHAPEILEVSWDMWLLVFVLQCLSATTLLSLLVWLFLNRHNSIVITAQIELLVLIIVIGLLTVAGVSTYESNTDWKCNVRFWAHDVTLASMLALLCGRVWRIDRLSNAAKQCQRKAINNSKVLLVALILITPQFLFTLARTAVHPSTAEKYTLDNGVDSEWRCESGANALVYDILAGCFGLALIGLGVFAAYRSSLLVDRFNEGKTIAFAMHNAVVLTFVLLPPSLLSHGDPNTSYFLASVSTLMIVVTLTCSLVIPRVILVRSRKESKIGYKVPRDVVEVSKLVGARLPNFMEAKKIMAREEVQYLCDLTSNLYRCLYTEMASMPNIPLTTTVEAIESYYNRSRGSFSALVANNPLLSTSDLILTRGTRKEPTTGKHRMTIQEIPTAFATVAKITRVKLSVFVDGTEPTEAQINYIIQLLKQLEKMTEDEIKLQRRNTKLEKRSPPQQTEKQLSPRTLRKKQREDNNNNWNSGNIRIEEPSQEMRVEDINNINNNNINNNNINNNKRQHLTPRSFTNTTNSRDLSSCSDDCPV